MDDTKLYIIVYIGMLDRDVGRGWQLWTQIYELLIDPRELVHDHPRLRRRLPPHPLAQRLQDVRYRLTLLLLAHKWRSCPWNPSQGCIMERQVCILRGGPGLSHQGTATLGNLR